jgi:hypothetical protein
MLLKGCKEISISKFAGEGRAVSPVGYVLVKPLITIAGHSLTCSGARVHWRHSVGCGASIFRVREIMQARKSVQLEDGRRNVGL